MLALSAMTSTALAVTKAPEFKPADGQSMTSTGGEFKLEYYSGIITCKNETMTGGSVTGKYTVGKVKLTFTGCVVTTSNGGVDGCPESSTGAGHEGEIVIYPLKGQLGTVPTTEAANGVGLLLEPETREEWAKLAKTEEEGKNCSIEQALTGKLAVGVGVLGSKQVTNKFTTALYQGRNIREIKLASGETVKPKLVSFGETAELIGVGEVKFGEATEVT